MNRLPGILESTFLSLRRFTFSPFTSRFRKGSSLPITLYRFAHIVVTYFEERYILREYPQSLEGGAQLFNSG